MSVLRPSCEIGTGRLLRAGVLVLVCALGGAVDVLNNSFAQWLARVASFPEEEEQHTAKDRGALVAAAHPARKGGLRPAVAVAHNPSHVHARSAASPAAVPHARSAHRSLTGAGIFQHC
jgi:hypothetical protein